ncbi:unnamed protein product [Adineta ricciae]|nr:unnamed protein product [Adineta ricciae]
MKAKESIEIPEIDISDEVDVNTNTLQVDQYSNEPSCEHDCVEPGTTQSSITIYDNKCDKSTSMVSSESSSSADEDEESFVSNLSLSSKRRTSSTLSNSQLMKENLYLKKKLTFYEQNYVPRPNGEVADYLRTLIERSDALLPTEASANEQQS